MFLDFYTKNRVMSGMRSHQKKFSFGAKSSWIGELGVMTSVTGSAWKLNAMMSMVAIVARSIFFPRLWNAAS